MTQYEIGEIDLTAQASAAKTATNHISTTDNNGITVHPFGNENDYTRIDSNGVKLYKGGAQVASFGDSATVGKANGPHTVIQSSGVDFYGASDGSVNLAHIGYASGNGASGIEVAPYYTFGERKTTTDVYSASSTYEVGDHVLYDGVEYVCTKAITSPEVWDSSHWERTIGNYSIAEGLNTTASDNCSHAEGLKSTALGYISHAEGAASVASGYASHAEGSYSKAFGWYSHAQNSHTIAASDSQTAIGRYNVEDANNTYALIVGNGNWDTNRSNAHTLT